MAKAVVALLTGPRDGIEDGVEEGADDGDDVGSIDGNTCEVGPCVFGDDGVEDAS